MIMFIGFKTLFSLLPIEPEIIETFQDFRVNGHWIEPHNHTLYFDFPHDILPNMRPDFLDTLTLGRVDVKYVLDQVFAFNWNLLGAGVVARQDFFVQSCSIGVFEWQLAAHHREQNDPAAPNVNLNPLLFLAGHHLGRSIARRTARCFEQLAGLVGVRKTEVNNF